MIKNGLSKEQKWEKFYSYLHKSGYVKASNGYYVKNKDNTQYRYIVHKHSVQYEKRIRIGKWKKINIGVWYIKDLKVDKTGNIEFKRNDLLD